MISYGPPTPAIAGLKIAVPSTISVRPVPVKTPSGALLPVRRAGSLLTQYVSSRPVKLTCSGRGEYCYCNRC